MAQFLVEFPEDEEETEEAIEALANHTPLANTPVPDLLRVVSQNKWEVYRDKPVTDKPWLAQGELQADVFMNLHTASNELSVWQIDDDEGLIRIIAALAANRIKFVVFDYALVDLQTVRALDIIIQKSPGDSKDEEANETWHYDLIQLTADKLLALAKAISDRNEIKRVPWKKVQEYIGNGVKAKHLNWDELSPSMQETIPKPTSE